jgi:cobalt-zinc-cadmium efflux system protein
MSTTPDRQAEGSRLKLALTLLLAFMALEVVVGVLASSLALLSDAAHMLTDAAALALALVAARLVARPAKGALTFGLGRAEILSAQLNGVTLLVLSLLIVYGAIRHLTTPARVEGWPVLAVAVAGIAVNLVIARVLDGHPPHPGHPTHAGHPPHPGHQHGHDDHRAHAAHSPAQRRSLNVEATYQHILSDLFGFIATAAAAAVILLTGFARADAIASLLIAAFMLHACAGVLRASMRVMMEAAPAGMDPEQIGVALAAWPGVAEVHDLHIWEVTSGFPAVSAHVVVDAGYDCHEIRRALARALAGDFGLTHSTLQVEHARAKQPPLQIEVPAAPGQSGMRS